MAHLFSVGVSRLGLSGRGPQGVSQTSSTRRLLKICAQQRTWSTVGGSKAPPKTATRTFGGVAAPLSAAMRRTAAAAMMAASLQRIAAKERMRNEPAHDAGMLGCWPWLDPGPTAEMLPSSEHGSSRPTGRSMKSALKEVSHCPWLAQRDTHGRSVKGPLALPGGAFVVIIGCGSPRDDRSVCVVRVRARSSTAHVRIPSDAPSSMLSDGM